MKKKLFCWFQYDVMGNPFTSTAFQISAYDVNLNPMDFWYSYSQNGTANLWKTSVWGPMQRDMILIPTGIYIGPTSTATGSITATFESLQ